MKSIWAVVLIVVLLYSAALLGLVIICSVKNTWNWGWLGATLAIMLITLAGLISMGRMLDTAEKYREFLDRKGRK